MTPEDIARALALVPEKHLVLPDLAWQLVRPDGSLDLEKAKAMAVEVGNATDEARAYIHETERLTWSLRQLLEP